MQHLTKNFQFQANIEFISEDSPCFKPPCYPPKDDFVMSLDKEGNIISRYGCDTWNFKHFGSSFLMHFSEYDETNKKLFKQLMFYVLYSYLFPGKYNSMQKWYGICQNIFRCCSNHGINASKISRFPKLIEEIAISHAKQAPAHFAEAVWIFDGLVRNKEQIGFTLLNEKSIALYKQYEPEHDGGQTAYIPNRIWTLFILNIDSVLNDFEAYQDKLESLYHYLAKTVLSNQKNGISPNISSPFNHHKPASKKFYSGTMEDYLKENGLIFLFEKYFQRPSIHTCYTYNPDSFGALLNNVGLSCFLYVLYYSIMRKKEALSLRIDCLKIERDERLGDFYLLAGETTKTDPDSDARWVVPKRVEKAIKIARTMVNWKLQYVPAPKQTPYLFQNFSVWQQSNRTSVVRNMRSFDNMIDKAHFFFKKEQYAITQKDYQEALALTPSLIKKNWFKVGNNWSFSYHQFRRTLAVHFALNKVPPSSTQIQMKHGTREQQFHYQNNAGRLRLNHSSTQEVVNEYYAEMSRNIISVVHENVVLPHKKSPIKQEVMHFVKEGEMKKLLKAQKNGAVGYRKNILGGCMKQGTCEFGGFDSIAHCSGGDGGKPCADLIIDGNREQEFKNDKTDYESQMNAVSKDSPRYRSLKAEVKGYETLLNIIKDKKVV